MQVLGGWEGLGSSAVACVAPVGLPLGLSESIMVPGSPTGMLLVWLMSPSFFFWVEVGKGARQEGAEGSYSGSRTREQ